MIVEVISRLHSLTPGQGGQFSISVIAFHENAGLSQVDFDLPFLRFPLSFMAEGVQSGPEQSRALSLRRQRTLDGEDRSVTIPPGRKVSGRPGFLVLLAFFLRAQTNPVATLPSALFDERFLFRSVQVGCSRCSRCCHLIVDLSSISRWKLGQAIDAVTGTRRWARCFRIREPELCGCR